MLYLRQNQAALSGTPINTVITDRAYQIEAIRRVCEAFEGGKRKALVVVATDTGKTRTAMSLVDVFLRTKQAPNILFVAGRDALVEQARKVSTGANLYGFGRHGGGPPLLRMVRKVLP